MGALALTYISIQLYWMKEIGLKVENEFLDIYKVRYECKGQAGRLLGAN
jgi:hypothetical protein